MPTTWLIPSWAPNFHPLVIHFPIVLVMTAAVVDLVDVAFERSVWLKAATTTLYVTGALSLMVAYMTGLQAASTVLVPGMAYPVITAHRQWALVTMAYCVLVATLRLLVLRGANGRSRRRRVALLGMSGDAFTSRESTRCGWPGVRSAHPRQSRRPRVASRWSP